MHRSPFPLTLPDEDFPLSGEGNGGLPAGFKRVEWLESTGTQYIDTGYVPNNETGIYLYQLKTQVGDTIPMGCRNSGSTNTRFYALRAMANSSDYAYAGGFGWGRWVDIPEFHGLSKTYTNYMNARVAAAENIDPVTVTALPFTPEYSIFMFAANIGGVASLLWRGRIYETVISQGESIAMSFVPCLDPEGAPCMFDLVSRKPFYNEGKGDFTYPNAAPVMSTDLEDKFYAKLTENGVRRLYKVPGYLNMTKDEYAAANGFKELVEPPMPQTGYWRPEWRETETQVICDWVETDPPEDIMEV